MLKKSATNIIFTGLGGQGILTAVNIIGKTALKANMDAFSSEVYGIAQRFSPVLCAIRIGNVSAGLIARGKADAIVSAEPVEAVRQLQYANRRTKVIIDTKPIIPVTGPGCDEAYPELESIYKEIRAHAKLYTLDVDKIAKKATPNLARNMALLGALSAVDVLPFSSEMMLNTIEESFSGRHADFNREGFIYGRKSITDPGA